MASSLSVNQSTFVPEIYFSKIIKSNSGLTMNWTASYAIAAVIQVLTFFWRIAPLPFRMLIIIIGSDSGDKINVIYNWGPQESRFTKKSPLSSRFAKKRVFEAKSLCNGLFSAGDTAHITCFLNNACV